MDEQRIVLPCKCEAVFRHGSPYKVSIHAVVTDLDGNLVAPGCGTHTAAADVLRDVVSRG